jgi:hypothetical protein
MLSKNISCDFLSARVKNIDCDFLSCDFLSAYQFEYRPVRLKPIPVRFLGDDERPFSI